MSKGWPLTASWKLSALFWNCVHKSKVWSRCRYYADNCSIEKVRIILAPFRFYDQIMWILSALLNLWMGYHCQLKARRALSIFKEVPLRTRRVLSLYNVYGNSALLVLNRTSLNGDSAFLTPLRTRRVLSLYNVYGDSALLVLNRTSLNGDSALLALSWHQSL